MGLDMYAYTAKADSITNPVEIKLDELAEVTWRKHPNLHGWMRSLYIEKGGEEESFNCVPVQLTADDIDRLEADIRAGNLPETLGFFFGLSDGTEIDDDLEFIATARAALANGLAVIYDSWW